jgi:hypothetical protein
MLVSQQGADVGLQLHDLQQWLAGQSTSLFGLSAFVFEHISATFLLGVTGNHSPELSLTARLLVLQESERGGYFVEMVYQTIRLQEQVI